jgi:hypothetical protein
LRFHNLIGNHTDERTAQMPGGPIKTFYEPDACATSTAYGLDVLV